MSLRRTVATFGLPGALALLAACHEHSPVPPGPCTDPAQVSLPNCSIPGDRFSDEACLSLDDSLANNRATTNETRAPTVMSPTEAQSVPAAAPFTFTWTAPTALRPRARPMTAMDELRRWTTLIPEAEAHCNPFSGRAYELRFRVNGAVVLRRQQESVSWTPAAGEWSRLVSAASGGRQVELTVYTAVLTNNQITAGNGPFVASTPRRFTIAN